ncbi:MAG: transcription antitermination factor NusB [Lentisphaerae bacterium]|nr:transcription antitermination factor NusB [Lentisphaerota bacterium]
MATRRTCREWAVQLLFQLDLNATDKLEPVFASFWKERNRKSDARGRVFTEAMVRGVLSHQAEIDAYLAGIAEHWAVGRMGAIERNVIRLAIYEMRHCDDVPPVVSINEAIDLAKYFSSSESGRFVNGILDRVRKDVKRPPRRPASKPHG